MIRILAGEYKNKKLKHFNFTNVRPTQARVKKSMFDSLGNLRNKKVLDLFCGVGTLGIEALSRGATYVTFVDSNYQAINLLKENLLLLSSYETNKVIYSDVFKFLNKSNDLFDIIIADPPYDKYFFNDLFPEISRILNNDGIFCYETTNKEKLLNKNLKIKTFGNTQLIYWRNNE